MADMHLLTYRGLHCGLWAQRERIPRQAQILRDTLRREGIEYWGPLLPGFDGFAYSDIKSSTD